LKTTLVTGGARSGKSRFAQELAMKSGGAVLFVATAEAGDEEMAQRIEEHRKARPSDWVTIETPTGVGRQIARKIGQSQTVVIDCITLLISNILQPYCQQLDEEVKAAVVEDKVMAEITELVDCLERYDARFIIVTNEVGLGLVPADKASRLYRDLLGKANQGLARHADEVYLMVAGIPVPIKAEQIE
jgi:adenosylcobinamide kinase/adenosylcobinamide-phosphate guanylyltransferase